MAWNDNISGTGTQADPYQVTTVEQFEGALAQRGAYLKIMNNIDFGGVSKRYTFSARYVDGNDKILSNFYVLNDIIFNLPQLYDGADPQEERKREFKNATLEFVIVSYLTKQMDPANLSKYAGVAACYDYDISKVNTWRNYDSNLIFTDCDVRLKYYGAIDTDVYESVTSNSGEGGSIFCRQRIITGNYYIENYPRIILNAYNSVFSIDAYMLLPYNGPCIFSGYSYTSYNSIDPSNTVAGTIDNCVVKINLYDKFGWNEEYTRSSNGNKVCCIVGHFNIISNTAFHINYIAKAKLHNNTYCNLLGYTNNLYNSYFVLNYPSFLNTIGFQATRFSTISFVATDHGSKYTTNCTATYDKDKQMKLISFEDAKNRETLESIGFVLKHTT
jgi:hypothetical protein